MDPQLIERRKRRGGGGVSAGCAGWPDSAAGLDGIGRRP